MRCSSLLCAGAVGAGVSLACAQPVFIELPDLDGGRVGTRANGVSDDGLVVVGQSNSSLGVEAFRWTLADGMLGLGNLGPDGERSSALAVSGDGGTIVGLGSMDADFTQAFRWTAGEGMVPLPFPDGFDESSEAVGASFDGSFIGGSSTAPAVFVFQAFRWTAGEGSVGIGDFLGGVPEDPTSFAKGVSSDGTTIVGAGSDGSGQLAFRWTLAEGLVELPDLAGGDIVAAANAVNADGTLQVGFGTSDVATEAVLWRDGLPIGLGELPGGGRFAEAFDLTDDGSLVVGHTDSSDGFVAFIWDEVNGMRDLRTVLIDAGVQGLEDWRLTQATGITPDGRTIVGWGENPDGLSSGWVVTIPAPGTIGVLGCAGLAACARRRAR